MKKNNAKVVVFTRKIDALSAKYDDNYNNVMSNDIEILPNEKINNFSKKYEILGDKKISNNSVLIAHPYKENCYLNIQDTDEIIQREKLANTANIARLLGAKSFEVESIIETEFENSYDFDVKGKLKINSLNINVKEKVSEKTKKQYSLKNEYLGSSPDFNKAQKTLIEYGLHIDPEIKGLVQSRNPIDKNLLLNQTIVLKASSELNKSLDVAANLIAMGGVLDISSSFNKSIKSRKSIELSIKINF